MRKHMRLLGRLAAVIAVAGVLSGCVVEEPGAPHGHGWCWWHPGACR